MNSYSKAFYTTGITSLILAYVPFAQLFLFGIGDNIHDGAHLILLPVIFVINLIAIVSGAVLLYKKFHNQSWLKSGLIILIVLLIFIQLPIVTIYYMLNGTI